MEVLEVQRRRKKMKFPLKERERQLQNSNIWTYNKREQGTMHQTAQLKKSVCVCVHVCVHAHVRACVCVWVCMCFIFCINVCIQMCTLCTSLIFACFHVLSNTISHHHSSNWTLLTCNTHRHFCPTGHCLPCLDFVHWDFVKREFVLTQNQIQNIRHMFQHIHQFWPHSACSF